MTVDRRNDFVPIVGFNQNITTDTTTNGAIIDTANTRGNTYTLSSPVFTQGTFTPVLEESDDSGMAGATDIADINLLGTEAGAVITDAAAEGAKFGSIGFFGTKRFVRLKIDSTGTANARIYATLNQFTVERPALGISA